MGESEQAKRRTAIHLLRSGRSVSEVAEEVERSPSWVYKWRTSFQADGWSGLRDHSRARKGQETRLPERVRQEIRKARSELEAESQTPGKLSYIGAHAVRARLQVQQILPLPSITSIER